MKERVSFTVDGEVREFLDYMIKKGNYRNKSHVAETAIKEFMAREKGKFKNQRLIK